MNGGLEWGRTGVIILWGIGRGVHGVVMGVGSVDRNMSIPWCTRWMGKHTG